MSAKKSASAGFRLDLHIHTFESGDNDANPEEVASEAIAKGLDGIAFTEHSSYEASEFAERLKEKYSPLLTILRGVEFSAREGHVLVFGVDTDKLSIWGAPVEDLLAAVKEQGGVAIPAHPFRGGSGIGNLFEHINGFTAVEGYNGCNLHAMNVEAVSRAEALGLPVTGGSDAHAPNEVGKCYTEFEAPVTEENFLDLLRGGRYRGVDERIINRSIWMPNIND